jgi:hypothetical protein
MLGDSAFDGLFHLDGLAANKKDNGFQRAGRWAISSNRWDMSLVKGHDAAGRSKEVLFSNRGDHRLLGK